jgi:hypothetical protein
MVVISVAVIGVCRAFVRCCSLLAVAAVRRSRGCHGACAPLLVFAIRNFFLPPLPLHSC